MIESPAPGDILCGKDKTYGKHSGNVLYRDMIQARAKDYATAPSKQDKMRLTTRIVQELMSGYGSRFLKKETGGGWEELSEAAARDKTSHALRFCASNTLGLAPTTTTSTDPSSATTRSVVSPVHSLKRPGEDLSSALIAPSSDEDNKTGTAPSSNTTIATTAKRAKRRPAEKKKQLSKSETTTSTDALSILAFAVESHCNQYNSSKLGTDSSNVENINRNAEPGKLPTTMDVANNNSNANTSEKIALAATSSTAPPIVVHDLSRDTSLHDSGGKADSVAMAAAKSGGNIHSTTTTAKVAMNYASV